MLSCGPTTFFLCPICEVTRPLVFGGWVCSEVCLATFELWQLARALSRRDPPSAIATEGRLRWGRSFCEWINEQARTSLGDGVGIIPAVLKRAAHGRSDDFYDPDVWQRALKEMGAGAAWRFTRRPNLHSANSPFNNLYI